MLKNYFKIAFRNLINHRQYSLINILGLTIGLVCCLLIVALVRYELSFDNFHTKSDQIYRVTSWRQNPTQLVKEGVTPYPLGPALRNDFGDQMTVTRMHFSEDELVTVGQTDKYNESNIVFTDPRFFEMFDFEVLQGDVKTDMATPNTVFLTQSTAKKYFGSEDPIGHTIKLDNELELEVKGVLADPPVNSHLPFNMVVSFESITTEYFGFSLENWGFYSSGYVYVLLSDHVNPQQIEQQLVGFAQKYLEEEDKERTRFHLQPLNTIHFDATYAGSNTSDTISYGYLIILSVIGLFILIIAGINFINLATAQAIRRAKEVGIRKTLGAGRAQLMLQFLGESFLLTLAAGVLSVGLAELALPYLNQLLEKQVTLSLATDPSMALTYAGIVLLVSVLSGLYPAFVLSGYEPIKALKSKTTSQSRMSQLLRQGLVVTQFVISLVLLVGTVVIMRQLDYLQSRNLGFAKDSIVTVPLPENDDLDVLRERWMNHSGIENITFGVGAPTSQNNLGTRFFPVPREGSEQHPVQLKLVDRHYLDVFDLELVAGRWLNEQDEQNASLTPAEERRYVYVVNEALVRKLNYENPEDILGQTLQTGLNSIQAEVVGVVKDFNVQSLHSEVPPVILLNFPYFYQTAGIKLSGGNMPDALDHIREVWENTYSNYLYEYNFLDDNLARLYENEHRIGQVFQIFAGLAILIGCLGLVGLVSFVTEQRTKEIGIRKVLGAHTGQILQHLSWDFLKLVLLAFALAVPVSYLLMEQWLANFAYRVEVGLTVFAIAGAVILGVALLSMSWQSLRAAMMNPVESLRSE